MGPSGPGFRVQRDRLLDAGGNDFVPRGINLPHAWFPDRLPVAIPAIAATGANAVRVVMSTGARWDRTTPDQIAEVLRLCKEHGMAAVLEVHDCTGWGELPEARPLGEAVDFWLRPEVGEVLAGQESSAILNIANEPFGNRVSGDVYVRETSLAIGRLRSAGCRHALMVDGANWGQDWEGIMRLGAREIMEADPDRNVVFSVHMYEHYGTEDKVRAYLDSFRGRLPLVVGEFAADHGSNGDVDELAILRWTREYGMGFMGWSWIGNAAPLEGLDIASTWGGELTGWGRTLVEGENGLKARSDRATAADRGDRNRQDFSDLGHLPA